MVHAKAQRSRKGAKKERNWDSPVDAGLRLLLNETFFLAALAAFFMF
jgi:hypothetical protein